MRFFELVPQKVIMEAPVVASVILNTESSRENSVIEKNEHVSQEHLIGALENNNRANYPCSPELDHDPQGPEDDDSEELEACAAAAASLEACPSVDEIETCKAAHEGYVTESSIIVRNESVIFTKSNDMLCNITLSAKNRNQSEIIKSPMIADKIEDSKRMCPEEDDLSSDTDGLSQDNLNDYAQNIKHTIVKDEDHIMRSAPVICMAPSLSHSGYGLPGGQGLPPVSTIIRSTARFEKSLSSLANVHLSQIDQHANVSLPEMIEMNVMQLIPSTALTPSDLSVVYAAQRSVVVSAPSDMNLDMSSVILNMSQQDTSRMLQSSKDIQSNMEALENNSHHMDSVCYPSHSEVLQHSKYIYDHYELPDSVHSDMNDHDMHDEHPMLSVAEAKNLIVASETKHFSSDEGSSESSPLLTVDSDMEVQDLTHRINSSGGVTGKPTLHGMPTGVITSSIRNLGMVDLPRNNTIQKKMEEAEAEDLSNRVKMPSMDISKNSDLDSASVGISSSSSLHGLNQSVLPSFLSSLASTSLASLSASLSGMPISGIPTSNSSHVQSSLMSTPTSVLLSSIMPHSSLLSVKPEPRGNSSESSQSMSPDASPITTSSNSVYSTLPSVSSTFSSLIKQEMNTPSCGPLPPFPVISGMPALKRTEASGNVSSSAGVFATSSTQLPPYSSMRMPPSVNIPTSPSSDSPTSSPAGVPSESVKKNEQFKEVSSSSLTPKNDGKDGKWCCLMCRNGSPCGLHPTQAQVSTSAAVSNIGPLPSGDPAKPYQCNLCGKNLASKNVYQLHMRSHSGEKPFRCNLCGHNFSQKTSLTRHMRSHTGERPFPCGVCGKRFADKERIKIHMRTHTGEKPFACEVCGKRFSQKSTVKRHMSVHTGEKPFKCDLCGKGFANRGNLNAHAKTHANS